MSVRPLITEMSVRGLKLPQCAVPRGTSRYLTGACGGRAKAPLPTEWDGKPSKMVGNTQSARK
jgi:hypothetical protein